MDTYKINGRCQSYTAVVHFPAHSINITNKAVYQISKMIIIKKTARLNHISLPLCQFIHSGILFFCDKQIGM